MGFDRQRLLERAQRFLKKGQIRRAISDYEKLVDDDPRNIRIRSKLADLYVRNHQNDRAIQEYVQLAKQYEAEDLNYRAISMYKKVLTLKPDSIDVHYWLADLYKKEGLIGNAKVLYQNIIRLNPKDRMAQRTLREIDRIGARSDPIQKDLGGLSRGQPHGAHSPGFPRRMQDDSLNDEALVIDLPSSEEVLDGEEIIDLEEPVDLPSNTNRSTEETPYLTHQKVDLEQEISPEKDLESHYHLGIAYMEMELIDEAISEFEAAVDYGPKRVDCLVMLGQCYREKGVLDRSIFYLEKAARLEGLTDEEYIRINRELGRAYEARGRKQDAWQAFKKAGLAKDSLAKSKT